MTAADRPVASTAGVHPADGGEHCRHCGEDIDYVGDGQWWSDSDDVCGTDLRRDHQPAEENPDA